MTQQFDFCLLIPCYNNREGLRISLKSVNYDVARYVILVVDDGSNEVISEKEIKEWLGEDVNVVVLHNERNMGITATLNNGLNWIKSNLNVRYIARLDCGDTCEAGRFQLQVSYMDEHPETGLLGSWCRFYDPVSGGGYVYKAPAEHKHLLRTMHFRNAFIHPTIMFRKELLDSAGFYPENFIHAEDYAFCWNLMNHAKAHLIQQVLVTAEINEKGLSLANTNQQVRSRWKVVKHYGSNILLKQISFLALSLRLIIPKGLILAFKKWRGGKVTL